MAQLEHIDAIERRLWSVADTLRANSQYASNEYFLPVMGLVRDFLWSDETGLPGAYSEPEVDSRADDVFRHLYCAYPTVPSPYYASSAA